MTPTWRFASSAVGIVCLTLALDGQGLHRYRDFALGSNLGSVADRASIAPSSAKTVHQRPAVLQELEWRPSHWIAGSIAPSTDPVEQIAFSFYNDQLFRIVVDYRHERTLGMTSADMIEAISASYGTPLRRMAPAPGRGVSRLEAESGAPVANWGDGEYSVVLYQTSHYTTAFRLMVTDTRLGGLARTAAAEAVRLDSQEAPQREMARQKKEQDDERATADKARPANKENFRP